MQHIAGDAKVHKQQATDQSENSVSNNFQAIKRADSVLNVCGDVCAANIRDLF